MGTRTRIADWSAGLLAVLVLVLGGLLVLKPAVDHWNDIYKGDPFEVGTKTQAVKKERAGQVTTTTEEASASPAERVLGRSGLILVRVIILALAAFLAAAALQRAILGNYSLRIGAARSPEPVAASVDSFEGTPGEESATTQVPIENGSNAIPEPIGGFDPLPEPRSGPSAPSEPSGGNSAWAVATLVASRREALGLSQRELAKRAGISHTVISRIESGQHAPSAKTVERLADALR
jgi:DNA-binding XRE family transcriptional regulator